MISHLYPLGLTTLTESTSLGTPWDEVPGLVLPAIAQTALLVVVVMAIVVALGTPLGVYLFNSSPRGLFPNARAHNIVAWFANLGRSLPFLVLMAAIIPFTKWVVGTTLGIQAAIIPMSIAGVPFFARLVENAIRDVPDDIIAVGKVSGGSNWQIIRTTQLSEALPGLAAGLTLNLIAMIEYSAIAGAIGAGGLGYLAVNYGYQQFDYNIMITAIVVLIIAVQIIQFSGDRIVRRLQPV